jgi:hypothetical protein
MHHDLESPPAVRQIGTDRDDVLALEIVGRFTASDLENAYGLLDAAYQLHDKIDLLVRISGYEGFDWSAAFSRRTARGKTQALKHIRRYAVVGGPGWIRTMIAVLGPLTPIETRHFAADDEIAAWEWIGARPLPA